MQDSVHSVCNRVAPGSAFVVFYVSLAFYHDEKVRDGSIAYVNSGAPLPPLPVLLADFNSRLAQFNFAFLLLYSRRIVFIVISQFSQCVPYKIFSIALISHFNTPLVAGESDV